MVSAKDIMEAMIEGDEYVNALMPIQVYHQINNELQEQMSITVSYKSDLYSTDEVYRGLINDTRKAKKIADKYKFNKHNL